MRQALRQVVRVVSTGCAYGLFFTGAVLLGWIVLPGVAALSRPGTDRAIRCRRIVRRSFVLFHDLLRVARVLDYDPRSAGVVLPAGACVIVANHPTLLDVTAIVSALPDTTFVVKSYMYRLPLLGRLVHLCAYVESGGGSPAAGARTAAACRKRLADGVPVLIFPEGTRSPTRGLGPFKRGATSIARRAGVPLVPLVLQCEPPTLKRGQPWYAVPPVTPVMTLRALPWEGDLARNPERASEVLQAAYESFLRVGRPVAKSWPDEAATSISTIANRG
ncbi:MAG: lysophospholipid acyltransferase family protein [Anaeromyxobacteraceae bacterium]